MAKVLPDGWRELVATGAAARELETLARLAGGLDDQYTVYHGAHWTRVERSNFAIAGEIDAIAGRLAKRGMRTRKVASRDPGDTKLLIEDADNQVKIEANAVFRGTVLLRTRASELIMLT